MTNSSHGPGTDTPRRRREYPAAKKIANILLAICALFWATLSAWMLLGEDRIVIFLILGIPWILSPYILSGAAMQVMARGSGKSLPSGIFASFCVVGVGVLLALLVLLSPSDSMGGGLVLVCSPLILWFVWLMGFAFALVGGDLLHRTTTLQ